RRKNCLSQVKYNYNKYGLEDNVVKRYVCKNNTTFKPGDVTSHMNRFPERIGKVTLLLWRKVFPITVYHDWC
ncbi:hypothetical protein Trydic_g10585, partial [Trypoxylus dichotomus]